MESLRAARQIERKFATPPTLQELAALQRAVEQAILIGKYYSQPQAADPLESRAATVQTPEENALLVQLARQSPTFLNQPRAAR